MKNRVVARYADGRMMKGSTSDFVPTEEVFHVAEGSAARPPSGRRPEGPRTLAGRKIQVVFKDGETIVGTTRGYEPGRPGSSWCRPISDANTERCYVVAAATKSVTLL